MKEVIYSSIMEHIGKTIEDKEISNLRKDLNRLASKSINIDVFDFMIIDKLISTD